LLAPPFTCRTVRWVLQRHMLALDLVAKSIIATALGRAAVTALRGAMTTLRGTMRLPLRCTMRLSAVITLG
jgi:hypothetical protein